MIPCTDNAEKNNGKAFVEPVHTVSHVFNRVVLARYVYLSQ